MLTPFFYSFSDITRGKENNPIQCVNGFDDEQPPNDYVYVTENCFTSPLHVDRTINSLQVTKDIQLINEYISHTDVTCVVVNAIVLSVLWRLLN